MVKQKKPPPFWKTEKGKRTSTRVLGIVFVLAFVVYLAADLVSNTLLETQIYSQALEENDIYNRFYTELLADPKVEQAAGELLTRLGLGGLSEGIYSLTTSTMYLILPPAMIQQATEEVIENTTAFFRGDTKELKTTIDLTTKLNEGVLKEQIEVVMNSLIAEKLSKGEEIKVELSGAELAAEMIGVLEANEVTDVLYVGTQVLETTEEQLVKQLNSIREVMMRMNQWGVAITVLIMAVALGSIVWLNGEDVVRMLRVSGLTLMAAGGLVLALWFGMRLLFLAQIPEILATTKAGLPTSMIIMIIDVVRAVVRELWESVWVNALLVGGAGVVLFGASHADKVNQRVKKWLTPVWPHRKAVFVGLAVMIVLVPPAIQKIQDLLAGKPFACNGHFELCDKPFNEMALAATHNGMSIAEHMWLWPSHDGSVTNQLNAGIRALLIDTHYFDIASSVKGYFPDATEEQLEVIQTAVNKVGAESREGTYLCHILCHLGSTPLTDTLIEVRIFLEENPREVMAIIFEDKISVEDTKTAFMKVELEPYLYAHKKGIQWPTLRQMIRDNKRLVVMAEVEGPPPDWYHHAWDYTEETPYSFKEVDELSCEPNRGGTGKDFFLLNHWIERVSPSRVDAVHLNDYEFLLNRARECEKERGKMPNFLAVNYWMIGDVVQVADTLNGVGEADE